jgi:hypothetical protein
LNEKPITSINSTVVIPENYSVSLFNARCDKKTIYKNNKSILDYCGNKGFLQKHQSASNMLIHSALVHKGDDSVGIKESSVSNYMLENGEASYISGVIYRTCRTAASENVFDSLQNDLVKLAYFQYTTPNVATMIASYKKIVNVVYINKLVKPNFYDYYHLCDIVYGNYTKCAITKGQWEEFFS